MIFVDVKPLEMQDWLIFISESHTGHLHLVSLSTGRLFFFRRRRNNLADVL